MRWTCPSSPVTASSPRHRPPIRPGRDRRGRGRAAARVHPGAAGPAAGRSGRGSYTLMLDGGLARDLDVPTGSFVLGRPGPAGFRLATLNGAHAIPLTGPATLALSGMTAGTLALDGSLPLGPTGSEQLDAMDA